MMADQKAQEINGGFVTRLKKWPKPILDRDGKPKRRAARGAVKVEPVKAEDKGEAE